MVMNMALIIYSIFTPVYVVSEFLSHTQVRNKFSNYVQVFFFLWGGPSLVAQRLKSLLAMRETWVRSLGWERSLGEGNGNPLQYSCLENSMDRGAWWATVHGVAKSRTRLSKRLDDLMRFFICSIQSRHRCCFPG